MKYFRSSRTETQVKNWIKTGEPLIVFDTETTGLEDDAKVIQFAAKKVKVDENHNVITLDEFTTFINPEWPLPGNIIEITGITDEMVNSAPKEDEAIKDIIEFIGEEPYLAAYNIDFDIKKMHHMYIRCGKEFKYKTDIDVIDMVRDLDKRLEPFEADKPAYNLGNVVKTFHLDDGLDFHKADEDVKATIRVMDLCIKHYFQNPNVEGFEKLDVKSVSLAESKSFTRNHKDACLYINTNRGLVYYNTFYRYFASSEIDLRFVNILKLENDVCKITETTPRTLYRYKRKVYKKFL